MIKPAILSDASRIVDMMGEFHNAANQPQEFDPASAFITISNMIEADQLVFISENGFICGSLMPSPVNFSWMLALELYWWSKDGKGVQLMNAFIAEAIGRGANEILVSHRAATPRIGRYMERSGFSHDGTVYRRLI